MPSARHKPPTDDVEGSVKRTGGSSRAFDEEVFERFVSDLGSEAVVLQYLVSFEAMLDGRINRINEALRVQDREETETALLSLQASAAMAGATQLEAVARRALTHHRVELTPRGPLVRQLQGKADFFRQALVGFRRRRTTSAA